VKVLTVDLTRRTTEIRLLEKRIEDRYVGGRGIAARLLFDSAAPGQDPLDPHAPLIFATGPITGTPFPMGGRFMAVAKSPLTNTIFSSSCGGRLGVSLRKSGIDELILTGAADHPCYLSIKDGDVRFLDAFGLWGKEKAYVKASLHDKHGADASILLIGKAGETGVLFANIENDGRYLGRGGLGAVLGSKNVKAIVVAGRGPKKIEVADREMFSFLAYECKKWLSANPVTSQALPRFGTGVLFNLMRETGLLSVNNYREPAPFESSALSGEMVTSGLLQKRRACPFCPVACGRVTKYGDGPEYESLWSLGANLLVHDLEKVAQLNGLCNELGMDTISAGAAVAHACELSEKGIIDNIAAVCGDPTAIGALLVDIAQRTGPGALLSLGTKRVADHFQLSDEAPQVKGLELPAYDPRGAYGNALGYVTSNRGGCHLPGYFIGTEVLGIPKLLDRFAVQGKATLLALNQNAFAFMDTLTLCRFAAFAVPTDYYARVATAVTGRKMSWEESLQIGERIWNLERLFNLREGVEADRLPERFTTFPLDDMLREYYAVRGWDEEGAPTKKKLEELGLLRDDNKET
jgi:aldehyde:ferredoxin oxidoreductase